MYCLRLQSEILCGQFAMKLLLAVAVIGTVVATAMDCRLFRSPVECRAKSRDRCAWCNTTQGCYNPLLQTCCQSAPGALDPIGALCYKRNETCCSPTSTYPWGGVSAPVCCPLNAACCGGSSPSCCHSAAACCAAGGPLGVVQCCAAGTSCILQTCCVPETCSNEPCCQGMCVNGTCMAYLGA